MFKRLSASLGLVLAAFAATTGISDAAVVETRSDVMYTAGAIAVVLLVLATIAYAVKVATGRERQSVETPEEAALGIRNSGFGGAYYDNRYGGDHGGHGSHDAGHDEAASHDDGHGHAAPAGAHGAH